MAIHHDKHAYGNLEKLNKNMSEEELFKMLGKLNAPENARAEEDKKRNEKGEKDDCDV